MWSQLLHLCLTKFTFRWICGWSSSVYDCSLHLPLSPRLSEKQVKYWSFYCFKHNKQLSPLVNPTFICAAGALILKRDQREVDALSFQQLGVRSPLHGPSVLKPNNDICVSDGGKTVCDGNCGPARAHLQVQAWLRSAEATLKGHANRQELTLSNASCTTASLSLSKADVAMSSSRILGFRIRARAIAILCFWPPLSWPPPSPTMVSNFWWTRRRMFKQYNVIYCSFYVLLLEKHTLMSIFFLL